MHSVISHCLRALNIPSQSSLLYCTLLEKGGRKSFRYRFAPDFSELRWQFAATLNACSCGVEGSQ